MEVKIDGVTYVPAPPACDDASPLETRRFADDLDREVSLREYLFELLATLWIEGESFSGKRPFGNSGWEYDMYAFLVQAGAVRGEFDEDGRLNDVDKDSANALMPGLIAAAMGLA